MGLGMTLLYAGRFDEAISTLQKAIRLDPIPATYVINGLGHSYFGAERYEEALEIYKQSLERAKKGEYNLKYPLARIAATYAVLGQEEEAKAHIAELLRIDPKSTLKGYARILSYYKNQTDIDRVINALRKAGLPE